MEQNPQSINVGYRVTLFQTIYYGREKKSNFAVEKSDKHSYSGYQGQFQC